MVYLQILITEKINFLYLHQLILVRENLEEEDGQTPTFYLSDTTYSSYIDRDRESNSKSIGGRVGFSFFPNKNNIFNFSFGLRSSDSDGDSKNIYTDFTTSGEQIGESKRFEKFQ